MVAMGSYNELLLKSDDMSTLIRSISTTEEAKKDEDPDSDSKEKTEKLQENQKTNKENNKINPEANGKNDKQYDEYRETGQITWAVFAAYFNSVLGVFGPVLIILIYMIAQALLVGADYWASYWANQEFKEMKRVNYTVGDVFEFDKRDEYTWYYSGKQVNFAITIFYFYKHKLIKRYYCWCDSYCNLEISRFV
jgi:hypothetical protein